MNKPLLIGGEWRTTAHAADVRDPSNGEIIASVCLGAAQDIDDAVAAAEAAARECAAMPAYRRAEILFGVRDAIRARREEFVDGIVRQVAKPVRYARAEVDRAIVTFTLAAEEATRMGGDVQPLDIAPGTEGLMGITRRFPRGVIAAITPFNFPLNLVAHKIAPAFAAGNATVLKPPPQAPLTSLLLAELFLEAGAPAGALNVVPCANDAAELLVRHARVAMFSFTGSAQVGWYLRSIAGKKHVVLELGGNAPVIVEDAHDLAHTATQIAHSAFAYAGQVCISAQRVFVQRRIYDAFLADLVRAADTSAVGSVNDDATVVGPMIDAAAATRIQRWIDEAVARGAHILTGGAVRGTTLSPTVMTGVPRDAMLCAEEAFAPVAIVEAYDDFEDAIERANDSRYGLQASVFTDSMDKLMRAFSALHTGGVIANNVPSVRVDAMPYGGVKDSGTGREGVRSAMREMTEERLLVLRG